MRRKKVKLAVLFIHFFFAWGKRHVLAWGVSFEGNKNMFVRFLLMKRGRYNRPFLHLAAMSLMGIGVVIAPFLAETYPVFSQEQPSLPGVSSQEVSEHSIEASENVFQTTISQKPRDQVITYRVEKGDTLSTIAKKFDVSTDTIRWANSLTSDSLSVGEELKILPVSGVVHKVGRGDTVYTIAKRYDTEPQKIVDFPFQDFADPQRLTLVEGQMVIVPDGIKPSEKPAVKRPRFIAQGPVALSGTGFTWPVSGVISQGPVWYHVAVDISAPLGTPVVAAHSGKVVKALSGVWDGGYGTNVAVENESGFQSLYAHLSGLNVSEGEEVVAGKTVLGWIGLSGRTTGSHVHLEIRKNGALVNPLPYLQ